MLKVKRVKVFVLQGFWEGKWHDINKYSHTSRAVKKCYHDYFLETDYPKRVILKIDYRVKW